VPGHVLHLRNLYCHCLSQPLPSLSFSVHISNSITRFPAPSLNLPPRFPCAVLTSCTFWHICCLHTEFERLPLVRLPFWRYRWKHLILYFLKSLKALQSDMFLPFFARAAQKDPSRARMDNRINSVPKLYSVDFGTFRVALLICYLHRCWNHVRVILSSAGMCHLGHALWQPRMPTLRNVGN
jgi:hypothetical protein